MNLEYYSIFFVCHFAFSFSIKRINYRLVAILGLGKIRRKCLYVFINYEYNIQIFGSFIPKQRRRRQKTNLVEETNGMRSSTYGCLYVILFILDLGCLARICINMYLLWYILNKRGNFINVYNLSWSGSLLTINSKYT